MASYTEEEFAQMIAQLEDSGQNAGVCIMAEMKKLTLMASVMWLLIILQLLKKLLLRI